MSIATTKLQIQLLEYQIELEESNYKYAIELQKDLQTLKRMRDTVADLKIKLVSVKEQYKKIVEQ